MADFSINAELKANASQFVSELKKGETSVNNFGGIIDKVLGPKGKLIMALTAATTAAVKFGQAMNASMSEIAKGTGATGEQLIKLRDNAHDALVNGVARSAKEVGTMIADLNTRFGVTGKELTVLTKEFSDFADVTGVDTKSAINTTADVMAKWNIQTEDANKLLDQLTKASQDSGAGVDELLAGLKQGQAVFSRFGMSASDSIAYMASLKKNGIDTSKALTGMQLALAKFSQQGINAKQGMQAVSEAIKNAKTDTEALNIAVETFGTRNGAEMVKVLRDGASSADVFKNAIMSAGGAVEATKEASRTSADAFKELKSALSGTFGGFGEGFDQLFKGLIDSVSNIVRMLDPIIRPIAYMFRDILGTVGDLVSETVANIKKLTEGNTGFKSLSVTLYGVYNIIHQTLGFILDSFKTAFGFIFAIINGKWDLAWEYLKKTLLTSAKFVLDTISSLLNTVKDNINVFIEKVINPFVDKLNWVQEKLGFEKTEKFGLIENFDLSKMAGVTDALEKVNNKIAELTGKAAAKITGDLGAVQEVTEETAGETQSAVEQTAEVAADVSAEIAKWNKKILQQKLEELKEYSDEYLETNLKIIEEERTKSLAVAKSEEERAVINQYYNKKIEKEYKKHEEAKRNYTKETVAKVAQFMKNMAKNVINVFKKIVSSVKKIVSEAFNILKKLVDINIDNMLDAMLEFEDGILTFFVETMPRLPSFIASAIESIKVLFATLKNYIKAETISDILFNILTQLSEALPGLISDLLGMVEELIDGVIDGLVRWLDADGIQTILNLIIKIQSTIERIVTNNLDKIVDMLANHIDDFANFLTNSMMSANKTLPKIFEALHKVIMVLIETIGKMFQNKEFIDSIIEAIKNIIKISLDYIPKLIPVIVDAIIAIIQAIVPELPKLILYIVNALIEAIPKVFSSIVSGLATIISEIFKAIFTPEFWRDVLSGLWEGITGAFSSIGNVGEAVGSAVGGHNVTGSGWGDIGLAVATGGISTLGKLFGWWATGTNAVPRGLSIVGEAGPELVNFRGGEQILNAHNTQKALENMGGNTNNFNVTFNNMQDTSAYAMIQQLKQYNREMAINGII